MSKFISDRKGYACTLRAVHVFCIGYLDFTKIETKRLKALHYCKVFSTRSESLQQLISLQ